MVNIWTWCVPSSVFSLFILHSKFLAGLFFFQQRLCLLQIPRRWVSRGPGWTCGATWRSFTPWKGQVCRLSTFCFPTAVNNLPRQAASHACAVLCPTSGPEGCCSAASVFQKLRILSSCSGETWLPCYEGWGIHVPYKAVSLIPQPPQALSLIYWAQMRRLQKKTSFEIMSSQLKIRVSLRLGKFRHSRYQVSKTIDKHSERHGHTEYTVHLKAGSASAECLFRGEKY